MMIKNWRLLNDMTQQEFDELLAEVKENTPNLFQFIEDFVDKKVTHEEVSVLNRLH